jgi:predicted TIM-barrel fold metal-dependent hydrolase
MFPSELRRHHRMGDVPVTYAHRSAILDADSHLMEGFDWVHSHADARTRALLPDLATTLAAGGANAEKAIEKSLARVSDTAKADKLAEDVIASAKGWYALGAMDPAERVRALDLLGFDAQLVFSTFSIGLFMGSDDLDLVYGGAAAHNRMMVDFCADPRLLPVGFLPLNDAGRSLALLDEAIAQGCRAMWLAHRPTGGQAPSHVDNEPVWAALAEAGIPIMLHVGGGGTAIINRGWHRNGRPRPVDIHGGGENLRSRDLPSVHHGAETFLTCLVLDGVFERHPALRCGVIELGASWAGSFMDRLDFAARAFARNEPLIGELTLTPSDYVRRQVRFTPFPGEDVGKMIEQNGPELYLFSSDYPHPEGTRDPIGRFEAKLDAHAIEADARRLFYTDNFRDLLPV